MFEYIILGIIQGITEWLPISSKSMIILAEIEIFNKPTDFAELIRIALFLHIGTFLAALIYLRRDVILLFKTLFNYSAANTEDRKLFAFVSIVTLISGIIGGGFYVFIDQLDQFSSMTGRVSMLILGIFLFVTGLIQLKSHRQEGLRTSKDLNLADGIYLGIAQGFAAIPGFSRSGLTVAALLARKFDDTVALRLSFIVSLPIVLAGNIILNLDGLYLETEYLVGAAASFLFGLLTMDWLLRIASRVNFGYFVVGFAILVLISALI